jgi:hypothetical protein
VEVEVLSILEGKLQVQDPKEVFQIKEESMLIVYALLLIIYRVY